MISVQFDNKSANTVTKVGISLFKPFKGMVITFTADNGKDYAYHEYNGYALSAGVDFLTPIALGSTRSCQNTNGLLW